MKKLLLKCLLFALIVCPALVCGQTNQQIDSVIKLYDYSTLTNDLQRSRKVISFYLSKAHENKYRRAEADLLERLSTVDFLSSDYQQSLKRAQESLRLYEAIDDPQQECRMLGSIGWNLYKLNSHESDRYFKRAIRLGEKVGARSNLAWIYDNYGVTLQDRNLDSAYICYRKSLELKKGLNDTIGIPYSYFKIATVHIARKEYRKALEVLDKTLPYCINSRYGMMEYHAYRGDVYFASGDYEAANKAFAQSLSIAKEINTPYIAAYNLGQLADGNARLGRFREAYAFKIREKQIRDSIFDIQKAEKFMQLQTEFETERNLREIAQQNEELALRDKERIRQELKLSQRNIVIYTIVFSVLFLAVVTFLVIRRILRKRREERMRAELENVRLQNTFNEEKLRISRELHDNIGSQLTFMISSVDNLAYQQQHEREKLSRIGDFGRDTLNELRSTVWALNERDGTVDSLCERLHKLVGEIPLKIHIRNEAGELVLPGVYLLNLFRVIQEFIQNSVKYADAGEVQVLFLRSGERLRLEMQDNGRGFDPETVVRGNGLQNMEQRCLDLGGDFKLSSSAEGTRVSCEFSIP